MLVATVWNLNVRESCPRRPPAAHLPCLPIHLHQPFCTAFLCAQRNNVYILPVKKSLADCGLLSRAEYRILLKVAIATKLFKEGPRHSPKDEQGVMEEEPQPKGATIVKDLLEATVGLAALDACMCACCRAVTRRARQRGLPADARV